MNIGIKSPFFNSEIVCKWAIRSSPRVCPYRWGKTTHGHQFQSEVVLVHERNDQQGAWGSSCLSRNWIWMTHDGSWWFMMVHESKVIDRPSLWVVLTHNDTYVTHCYPNPVVMVSCEPCCEMSFVAKILPQQRQSATSGRVFPMRTGLCWQVGLSLHTGETGSDAFQPLGTVWEIVQVLDAGEVFFALELAFLSVESCLLIPTYWMILIPFLLDYTFFIDVWDVQTAWPTCHCLYLFIVICIPYPTDTLSSERWNKTRRVNFPRHRFSLGELYIAPSPWLQSVNG